MQKSIHSLLLTLLMIGFTLTAFGQRALYKPQVHEISLQALSFNHIPEVADYYSGDLPGSLNFVNGIRYKYHHSISDGFRFGAFYRNAEFEIPDGIDRFSSYSAKKEDFDITLGYERKHHMGASQVFAGLDAILSRGRVQDEGVTQGNNYLGEYTYTNLGGQAFVGYSFFFSQNVSLTFEAKAYYTQTNHQDPANGEPSPFYLLPESEFGMNGSVYLSIHLVRMKKRCTCPKH